MPAPVKLTIPALLLVVGFPALAPAVPAAAHTTVVSSTPAEGQTLTALPAEFSLTAGSDLFPVADAPGGFVLQILDTRGRFYGDGCVTVAGPVMSTRAELGTPGEYRVRWAVRAQDGHPLSGEYAFTWAPEGDHAPADGSEKPSVCGQGDPEPDPGTGGPSGPASPGGSASPSAAPADGAADPGRSWSSMPWIAGGLVVALAGLAVLLRGVIRNR